MAEYCPGWCESSHPTELTAGGLLHRSRGVEARSLDPAARPLRARVEGWYDGDDQWWEAVDFGVGTDDGFLASAGAAARFGAALLEQAMLLDSLVDDPVALRLALAVVRAEQQPVAVRIERVAVLDVDRVMRVRRRDGEGLVIAVQKDHVSPEFAGEMEVVLAALLAANGAGDGRDG